MVKITFLGAAGTVTGSKYLIEAEGKRLLVDCGLFEGSKELKQRNWDKLPIDPATIDWVLLTHAHIDHTGYLPRLVRNGYRGPIYANAATHELCAVLLPDSAHLQEEDARFAAKKGYTNHKPPLPLYTVVEAQTTLTQFREIPSNDSFTISPQFSVRPHDAGHILGATWLELTITEGGKKMLVVFSGDVGRYSQPLLNDPESPARADFLLCEATYGDREHPSGSVTDELADVINRTAKRGGAVVIPAFAVDRTQLLMYYLRELLEQKRIPQLPVYVDSPMAISVTDMYARHHGDHDFKPQSSPDPLNVKGGAFDAHGRRFEEDQRCRLTLHHHFGQRNDHRGPHPASSGAPAAGFAQLRPACGLSGGGYGRRRRCRTARSFCVSMENRCPCERRLLISASFRRTQEKANCSAGFPAFRRRLVRRS